MSEQQFDIYLNDGHQPNAGIFFPICALKLMRHLHCSQHMFEVCDVKEHENQREAPLDEGSKLLIQESTKRGSQSYQLICRIISCKYNRISLNQIFLFYLFSFLLFCY